MTGEKGTMVGPEVQNGKISLDMLAKMTGFPIELIKDEVFHGQNTEEVSLEELRAAMLSYIDSTMLIENEKKKNQKTPATSGVFRFWVPINSFHYPTKLLQYNHRFKFISRIPIL